MGMGGPLLRHELNKKIPKVQCDNTYNLNLISPYPGCIKTPSSRVLSL
jgi:hypothetical protein